jgi:hypothetical protein
LWIICSQSASKSVLHAGGQARAFSSLNTRRREASERHLNDEFRTHSGPSVSKSKIFVFLLPSLRSYSSISPAVVVRRRVQSRAGHDIVGALSWRQYNN